MNTNPISRPNTLSRLLSYIRASFPNARSYGVNPNILVVPPSMLLYLALAPEEKASLSHPNAVFIRFLRFK